MQITGVDQEKVDILFLQPKSDPLIRATADLKPLTSASCFMCVTKDAKSPKSPLHPPHPMLPHIRAYTDPQTEMDGRSSTHL